MDWTVTQYQNIFYGDYQKTAHLYSYAGIQNFNTVSVLYENKYAVVALTFMPGKLTEAAQKDLTQNIE